MDDTLKRLLDVEARAVRIVDAAKEERQQIIEQALRQARASEAEFMTKIPTLQRESLAKAQTRAQQAVVELQRHYHERMQQQQEFAAVHEQAALQAALALLATPGAGSA